MKKTESYKRNSQKNIVVTAGPTYEPIDPVRIISNRSTGLMGYEIAKAALKRRHKVVLISGPVNIQPPSKAKFIKVEEAKDMKNAVLKEFKKADCLIMAAAVSDFKAKKTRKKKIKKKKGKFTLELSENPDILKSLSKKSGKALVGFALETDCSLQNAQKKMVDKKLDLIIANKRDFNNDPFGEGKKDFALLRKNGPNSFYKHITKKDMAKVIIEAVEEAMNRYKC